VLEVTSGDLWSLPQPPSKRSRAKKKKKETSYGETLSPSGQSFQRRIKNGFVAIYINYNIDSIQTDILFSFIPKRCNYHQLL